MTGLESCCAVRFALVVPRSLFDRTRCPAAGSYFLERISGPKLKTTLAWLFAALPVDPALFLWPPDRYRSLPAHCLAAAWSDRNAAFRFDPYSQRHLSRFGSFLPLRNPRNSGQKSPHPQPQPAGGVVILEPFRERSAGPKHTRAEQDQN